MVVSQSGRLGWYDRVVEYLGMKPSTIVPRGKGLVIVSNNCNDKPHTPSRSLTLPHTPSHSLTLPPLSQHINTQSNVAQPLLGHDDNEVCEGGANLPTEYYSVIV